MTRNILDAAHRVATASDAEITLFAKHDPDIFRDIAQRIICFHEGIDVWVCGNGRISYPSRQSVKNLSQRLKQELSADMATATPQNPGDAAPHQESTNDAL